LQSWTSGKHLLGFLEEIEGRGTITGGQSRLGIFQQRIVAVYAGFRIDRFGGGIR
jgi:hypothetical protein